jgi:hypothetical protein
MNGDPSLINGPTMSGAVIRRNICVNNHLTCSENSIFIFALREHAIPCKKKKKNVGSRDDVSSKVAKAI